MAAIDIGTNTIRMLVADRRGARTVPGAWGGAGAGVGSPACLREAENRADFLEAAAGEGIDIEVIGPAEEARLTWEGIRWAVAGRPGDVAMDIGGGSTEFVFGAGGGGEGFPFAGGGG